MNNYGKMIFESCKKEDIRGVKYYIRKGGDVNYQSEFGQTPLMIASLFGSKEIAKILIKSGADAKISNDFGCTAIVMAKSSFTKDSGILELINKKEGVLKNG